MKAMNCFKAVAILTALKSRSPHSYWMWTMFRELVSDILQTAVTPFGLLPAH